MTNIPQGLNKLELSQVIGVASSRCRVSIVLLAFSGIDSSCLGSVNGTEGLRLDDFLESSITSFGLRCNEYPAILKIRLISEKERGHSYACVCEEGLVYINEYLTQRMQEGERLCLSSPLIHCNYRDSRYEDSQNLFVPTAYIEGEIQKAFTNSGLPWKPRILRKYFEKNVSLARKNEKITDQEMELLLGHSNGNTESSLHVDQLAQRIQHQMRQAYNACKPYLSTVANPITQSSQLNESNGWVYV